MLLAALLMMPGASPPEQFDPLDERYSVETQTGMMEYITCIATGLHERREQDSLTETDAKNIRAACQNEFDNFVENVTKDLDGFTTPDVAANLASSYLNKTDLRAIFVPQAPENLAKLPVGRLIGDWQLGGGSLTTKMGVRFAEDGSLVGAISPGYGGVVDGLRSWRIVADGTENATLHASFADGSVTRYASIPSFPGEMTFVNASNLDIQRFDLKVEDGDFVLSYVKPGSGSRLRFRKQIESAGASQSE